MYEHGLMRTITVRYRVKPERAEENKRLVKAVFASLAASAPEGLHYATFVEPDGVSFVHVATIDGEQNPLQADPAFKAFTAEIEDRCEVPPQPTELTHVGSYAFHPK